MPRPPPVTIITPMEPSPRRSRDGLWPGRPDRATWHPRLAVDWSDFRPKVASSPGEGRTMVDLELCYTPATELAKRIRSKQLSPVELVKNSLARIEQVNPKINCFCFVFPEEAIEQAKKAEAAVMRGDKL